MHYKQKPVKPANKSRMLTWSATRLTIKIQYGIVDVHLGGHRWKHFICYFHKQKP